jgi:hypothetical protein
MAAGCVYIHWFCPWVEIERLRTRIEAGNPSLAGEEFIYEKLSESHSQEPAAFNLTAQLAQMRAPTSSDSDSAKTCHP